MAAQHNGDSHGEHKSGTMDISVQEKTFAGFLSMVTKGAIISIGILIFMALVNS